MAEEVFGLVQIMGGIAAQCFAPRLIKSTYVKSIEKVCCYEITDIVKELFRNDENLYTKTVLSYMKTPSEEVEALITELKKKNIRPEVVATLNLKKNIEVYELIYNSYLKSPLYLIYKDNIEVHLNTIKRWLQDKQTEARNITKSPQEQLIDEGSKLLGEDDYEKALNKFKEASKNIKNPSVLANMGNVYFLQGKYEDAKDAYLEAIKLNPREPAYYITLGNIYDKQGLYEKADEAYEKAIKLDRVMEEIIFEKRLFEFWKKIDEKKKEHLKKLLNLMSIPAERARIIENQVKRSLGIKVEEKKAEQKESDMKVLLQIEEGPGGKETFEFNTHDTFVVGRSKINTHSQLKGDRYISRHHFILELNPPFCFLKDLGSTNGTRVNGNKLEKGELKELCKGDRINVGKTTLSIDIIKEDKEEEEGTLLIPEEVFCVECGKNVIDEVMDKPPEELEGLIYTCKKCVEQQEAGTLLEVPDTKPVFCSKCNKDVTHMANKDGKMELFRNIAIYICPSCKPFKDNKVKKDSIGDYDLLSLLGFGGMGEVYKAWHRITGRLVALKKILPMAAMKEKNHKLFQREMNVMSKLVHPNIVSIFDQGRVGKEHYFATEFLNGGDADGLITKRYLAPVFYKEACEIIMQSLEGLHFAHTKSYIHRDIKPQNILIHREKNKITAKISDFGLAKNFQEAGGSMMTKEGEIAGTVLFMAPEQLLNYKYVKPPADVYSMGVSLYYLISGKYPFNYPSPLDQIKAFLKGQKINMKKYADPLLMVLSEPPIPVENQIKALPTAIARVVNKSVQKVERDRYMTAEEFKNDIEAALKQV